MKKYLKNYFLTFYKAFNKIFYLNLLSLFLTLFCLNAQASNLNISPIQACNLLEEQGLKANMNLTNKTQNNNFWNCTNNPSNNSKKSSIAKNDKLVESPLVFNYQASGNNKEVNNIEVEVKVNDKNYTRLMQKKLIEISEIITKKTIGISNIKEIKNAITNSQPLEFAIENFIIKISQNNVSSNNNSYIVNLKIYPKN